MDVCYVISIVSLVIIVGGPMAVLWHSHRQPTSKD